MFRVEILRIYFRKIFLGEDRTLVCVGDLRGFFMFSLDFRNILFLEELHDCSVVVFFCDTLSVGC